MKSSPFGFHIAPRFLSIICLGNCKKYVECNFCNLLNISYVLNHIKAATDCNSLYICFILYGMYVFDYLTTVSFAICSLAIFLKNVSFVTSPTTYIALSWKYTWYAFPLIFAVVYLLSITASLIVYVFVFFNVMVAFTALLFA